MREAILIKTGEIALKGLNRHTFEQILVKNIRFRLKKFGKVNITKSQSTIRVEPKEENMDFDEMAQAISKIFGISAFSRTLVTKKNLDVIKKEAVEYLKDQLPYVETFKVEAKRSDKQFPYTSPQLQQELGAALLEAYPHLKVDVHHPQLTVTVEIRDEHAYVHGAQTPGAGGMPVSSSGKAMVLISGGIDSPVAAYMMAKRGLLLHAIHFQSPPYTSERALEKVENLCKIVSQYSGRIQFHCVPFTEIQEAIREHCPDELFTLIMRRLMMEIAQRESEKYELQALITGESLGQVASQTIGALGVTDAVAHMPVFRPLIGMDKEEIIQISRQIGTFETSILPYEDCCTVFTPRHPKTRPNLKAVEEAQNAFDFEPLIQRAMEGITLKMLHP